MLYAPRLEPFGYAPLEASACGLPVVGVREGGVRETVNHGHTGYLADAEPASMGDALAKILSNPDLGRRLGANGRRWVAERWSTEHLTARLEAHLVATARPNERVR